jgi:hypothetical protein
MIVGEDRLVVHQPERADLRRDLVGRELVGQAHAHHPQQRQQDHRGEHHQYDMRAEAADEALHRVNPF